LVLDTRRKSVKLEYHPDYPEVDHVQRKRRVGCARNKKVTSLAVAPASEIFAEEGGMTGGAVDQGNGYQRYRA
jgi:hypothetical protein